MRIVERIGGYYEAQKVEFGMVYTWRPESLVAECECGKRATYKRSEIISGSVNACACGEAHTSRIREELAVELLDEEEDKTLHPWRDWPTSKNSGLPF
jgi:hypothetical protein